MLVEWGDSGQSGPTSVESRTSSTLFLPSMVWPTKHFHILPLKKKKIYIYIYIYIYIFGYVWSYLPHVGSFVAEHRLLSSCGAWAPECLGPVFAACGLSCPHGMWDIGSQTRDGTHVPCIGKQILNHRTTREVPYIRDLCHISPYEVSRPRVLSPVYWKRDAHMIT